MPESSRFHDHYKKGFTPWDNNRVDHSLVQFVKESKLAPCPVLDAGCGTGNNCIWLAQQGFTVTGWDFVPQALDSARQKAGDAKVSCSFEQKNILNLDSDLPQFDFIFDRGLFHCFKSSSQLDEIARIFASLLPQNGIWLSLIGNADEPRTESGPPQLSATEITATVEPFFIIDSLVASFFDSDHQPPPKNWVCQMRKR
jgi:SAM-dependent methyltransferase